MSKSVSYWAESEIEKIEEKIAVEVIKVLEVKRAKFKEGKKKWVLLIWKMES